MNTEEIEKILPYIIEDFISLIKSPVGFLVNQAQKPTKENISRAVYFALFGIFVSIILIPKVFENWVTRFEKLPIYILMSSLIICADIASAWLAIWSTRTKPIFSMLVLPMLYCFGLMRIFCKLISCMSTGILEVIDYEYVNMIAEASKKGINANLFQLLIHHPGMISPTHIRYARIQWFLILGGGIFFYTLLWRSYIRLFHLSTRQTILAVTVFTIVLLVLVLGIVPIIYALSCS